LVGLLYPSLFTSATVKVVMRLVPGERCGHRFKSFQVRLYLTETFPLYQFIC